MDYTGKQFGKVTLLRYSRPGGKGVGAYWLGQCECGNRKEYLARHLKAGRIKSCGKCIDYRRLIRSRESEKERLRRWMGREVKRSVWQQAVWHLSPTDFYSIIKQDCLFCGSKDIAGVVPLSQDQGYTSNGTRSECYTCRNKRGKGNVLEHLMYCASVFNYNKSLLTNPQTDDKVVID